MYEITVKFYQDEETNSVISTGAKTVKKLGGKGRKYVYNTVDGDYPMEGLTPPPRYDERYKYYIAGEEEYPVPLEYLDPFAKEMATPF